MDRIGAVVHAVEPGSLAKAAGIEPGDVITAINGQAFTDLIEYRFLISDSVLEIDLHRAGTPMHVRIEKEEDERLGITFSEAVFDGVRTCVNSCLFCFLHQLPPGMRRSLYTKDDDYRLSVTQGHYITLTNLNEADFHRILLLHLGPLYISVHATDPAVRTRLLRNPRAGELLSQMRRLAEGGIEMHCQVVLCPGYNDGAVLDQTLSDLARLWPSVRSVAVVPVGLTRFRTHLTPIPPVTEALARTTVCQIESWQEHFRHRLGTRFVFAADELYLKAGLEVPPRAAYENFPQTEDGIGLVRLFLDELEHLRLRKARPARRPKRILLVTGMLAQPLIEALAQELCRLTGHQVKALAVPNSFFGETITVAGLLTGRDILQAVQSALPTDRVYVPTVMLQEDRFLDDLTLAELSEALGIEVRLVEPSPKTLARALRGGTRPPLC